MNRLAFLLRYIFKPRTVGAVLPSSHFLASKMVRGIDFDNAEFIAEYGPGTGVFTDMLLSNRKANTQLLLIENDESFCEILRKKYKNVPNLHIANDSAENIAKYLAEHSITHADYIISGLPFASLPQNVSINILEQAKRHLKPNGAFITFQYTLLKKDFIGGFFKNISITRELRNVPPAYVLHCKVK
ncbi:MAG: methyltransferase domain-containing protein [Defluviitaleaceae bacterium]|nr:methyltransferase domain-containing protein [Defluviitaleaceae bacterium]